MPDLGWNKMIDTSPEALAAMRELIAERHRISSVDILALIDALEEARAALEPFAKLAAPLVDDINRTGK